jgi:hypothetical protein
MPEDYGRPGVVYNATVPADEPAAGVGTKGALA